MWVKIVYINPQGIAGDRNPLVTQNTVSMFDKFFCCLNNELDQFGEFLDILGCVMIPGKYISKL